MQCLLSIQARASAKYFLPIILGNPYSNQTRTPEDRTLPKITWESWIQALLMMLKLS